MAAKRESRSKKARRRARDEGIEASLEAMLHEHRGRLVAMAKADKEPKKGTPEWQKNVAIATNAAGAVAGPAALWMAVRQAKSKQGGMPRQAVEAVEAKSKPTTRTGRAARATGKVLRNPKAVAAGGVTAVGLQGANWAGDAIAARALTEQKKRDKQGAAVAKKDDKNKRAVAASTAFGGVVGGGLGYYVGSNPLLGGRANRGLPSDAQIARNFGTQKLGVENMRALRRAELKADPVGVARRKLKRMPKKGKFALLGAAGLGGLSGLSTAAEQMSKADGQSLISKSDPVVVTGNGKSLVEKRNFNAEADRQRRLGLYTGAGLGAGIVLGDAARRRAPLKTVELKDGTKRKIIDLPRGRGGRVKLAALAAGSALAAGGGVAAYRRGISERNNAYL